MKKVKEISIVMLVMFFLAGICWAIDAVYTANRAGAIVQPGQMHTVQNGWVVIDATTTADNEPGDPNAVERTYALIVAMIADDTAGDYNAEISIYGDDAAEREEMSSWNGVRFRCIGMANGVNVVYEIYLGTLEPGDTDCELSYAGNLDFTIGQQVTTTSTYEFADTLTVTPSDSTKSWGSSSPTGERVAQASIDLEGDNIIVAVCTTTSCNCKLLGKGY